MIGWSIWLGLGQIVSVLSVLFSEGVGVSPVQLVVFWKKRGRLVGFALQLLHTLYNKHNILILSTSLMTLASISPS